MGTGNVCDGKVRTFVLGVLVGQGGVSSGSCVCDTGPAPSPTGAWALTT